jgi:hypothetical protein
MRPLQPRKTDLQKWRRLIREVRAAAKAPHGPSGDLSRAASTACRAVAPTRELQHDVCSPLLRGCERFCDLHPSHRERPGRIALLAALADRLAPHVGVGSPAAAAAPARQDDDDAEDRPQRKDIYG